MNDFKTLNSFKTQTELTTWAYNYSNGNREEMVELVMKELKAFTCPLKPEKRYKLDMEGDKGYRAYAKVKVKEHFSRVLPRLQARYEKPTETKVEAPAPAPEPKAEQPANVVSLSSASPKPTKKKADFSWDDIMEQNKKNKQRLAEERANNNNSTKRQYRIK